MKTLTRLAAASLAAVLLAAVVGLGGCGSSPASTSANDGSGAQIEKPLPAFSLAWSEYPSWSVFGVADELGLIDGRRGEVGPIETKWGVDIELKQADYDPCLTMYGAGQCDAVCITNMDALNPSLSVPSVAILPTSTSCGADALIVDSSITGVQQLKGRSTYGLAKSVSEYCFVRNLERLGEDPLAYPFVNMDPAAAALALQQKHPGCEAIVVWNPFVMETLRNRPDARVLFDSASIPGEIIDMVVVSKAALGRPGGEAFAGAVLDAFYTVNRRLADPATRDETLVALGAKFSHLDADAMKTVVTQTRFFTTPEQGEAVLASPETRATMARVAAFCVARQIVAQPPAIGFGSDAASAVHLRFDPAFVQRARTAK